MAACNKAIPLHDRQDIRSLGIICCLVIAAHLLFVAWAWSSHALPKEASRTAAKRLTVQTVKLSPRRMEATNPIVAAPEKKLLPESAMEIAAVQPIIETVQEVHVEEEVKLQPITSALPEAISESKLQQIEKAKPQEMAKSDSESKPQEFLKPQVKAKDMPIKNESPKPKKPNPVLKKSKSDIVPPSKKAEAVKNKGAGKKPKVQKKFAPATTSPVKSNVKSQETIVDRSAFEKQKRIEEERQRQQAQQQKLLMQAKETIAKIDKTRDKLSSSSSFESSMIPLPGGISSLEIDGLPEKSMSKIGDHESSYRSELASRLKLLLKLPEYGDVNIKLTIDRSGRVANVVVVSAESGANRKYIEKTLPALTFPSFGSNFSNAAQFTFSITLSNEL